MKKKLSNNEEQIVTMTVEEALSLLNTFKEKRKKRVHTFEGTAFGPMGCDVDLSKIKKYLQASTDIQLAGPNMRGVSHAVAFKTEKGNYMFIETQEKLVKEFCEKKNITL